MFNQALDDITIFIGHALKAMTSDVASHPGRFTEDELSRLLTKKTVVRIAIENTQRITVTGQSLREARLLMAAYVICSDSAGLPRNENALALTEAIVSLLPFNRFGPDNLKPIEPCTISADNLYSGEIDRQGIALWGITRSLTENSLPYCGGSKLV